MCLKGEGEQKYLKKDKRKGGEKWRREEKKGEEESREEKIRKERINRRGELSSQMKTTRHASGEDFHSASMRAR